MLNLTPKVLLIYLEHCSLSQNDSKKLEKWTLSHLRALEDRMGDVEIWLVEKETEKQSTPQPPGTGRLQGITGQSHGRNATRPKR
jgi:hypothetical protein